MIKIKDKSQCCGCGSCMSSCPKQCIRMKTDSEGFAYPEVDTGQCISCGKCIKVCPIKNRDENNKVQKVYAVKNKNEKTRSTSSSGGTFFELAKYVIENGGTVFGCAMSKELVAQHIAVTTISELEALKSSKYVQSDVGNTYSQAKELLENGKLVLYSGTPCQIAGLKNYLGKCYDNLILIDVLCHGTPSPGMFKDYIALIEKRFDSKPISINFRSKEKSWKRLYIDVHFEDGRRYFTFCGYDQYLSMFLNNMSLRPSCYECKFTTEHRQGDITLGDFWGIGKKYPERDDDKGISLVLINTDKGVDLFDGISSKLEIFESDFETAAAGQRTLSAPTIKNTNRDDFYKEYSENGIESALNKFVKIPSKPVQVYYAVMRWGLDLVRKILKKGY
ncbi:MAG: Coenzyme F420 hydrogenase/dehydrogenase, beta subunit C-terminal domain [bacterium]|nr:Coenzyme F420 hydrogenase/dehydrogenase, beta subunit C-terminal domain [bacterium]